MFILLGALSFLIIPKKVPVAASTYRYLGPCTLQPTRPSYLELPTFFFFFEDDDDDDAPTSLLDPFFELADALFLPPPPFPSSLSEGSRH